MHMARKRESPLTIYMGLMLHTKTRKRNLIDIAYSLGLSIPYKRVLEISTELGNKATEQYISKDVVYPTTFSKGFFTTAAVDNINHQTSATSCDTHFNGTGISLNQTIFVPTKIILQM